MMNKLINTIGSNGLNMLSKLLLSIVIVKNSGLSSYGNYGLILSLAAPLFLLANFKIRSIVATDIDYEFDFKEYYQVILMGSLFSWGIILLVSLVFDLNIFITILVCILKTVENIYYLIYGELQRRFELKKVIKSQYFYGLTAIIALIICYAFDLDIYYILLSNAVTAILVLMLYDFKQVDVKFKTINLSLTSSTKYIIHKSFKFSLSSAINSLNTNLPRYAIAIILGERALGIYLAIYNITSTSGLLIAALAQNFNSKLANLYRNKSNDFIKVSRNVLMAGFFVGIIGACISLIYGNSILLFFYNRATSEYSIWLVFLFVNLSLQNITALRGMVLSSMKIYGAQLNPVLISTAILCVILYPLTLYLGMNGVFLSIFISTVIQLLIFNNIYYKAIKFQYKLAGFQN